MWFRAELWRARELRSKGIVNLTASTMPDNAPMVAFLTKAGLEKRGAHTFGGNQWIDFCRSIDTEDDDDDDGGN